MNGKIPDVGTGHQGANLRTGPPAAPGLPARLPRFRGSWLRSRCAARPHPAEATRSGAAVIAALAQPAEPVSVPESRRLAPKSPNLCPSPVQGLGWGRAAPSGRNPPVMTRERVRRISNVAWAASGRKPRIGRPVSAARVTKRPTLRHPKPDASAMLPHGQTHDWFSNPPPSRSGTRLHPACPRRRRRSSRPAHRRRPRG